MLEYLSLVRSLRARLLLGYATHSVLEEDSALSLFLLGLVFALRLHLLLEALGVLFVELVFVDFVEGREWAVLFLLVLAT